MKSLFVGLIGFTFVLIGSTAAYAGTIQITASGETSTIAEFVRVNVTVTSKCYKTSIEAAKANAALAKDIRTVMEPYAEEAERAGIKNPYTEVGGRFERRNETYYEDNKSVILCQNAWRTSKRLTLKLKEIEKLPQAQDAILVLVDQNSENPSLKDPQTWALWSSPQPALTPATQQKSQLQALRNALANAEAELSVLVEECNLVNPELSAVGPLGYSPEPRASRFEAQASAEGAVGGVSDTGSSFSFGEIPIRVMRTFTFEFDGGLIDSCPVKK